MSKWLKTGIIILLLNSAALGYWLYHERQSQRLMIQQLQQQLSLQNQVLKRLLEKQSLQPGVTTDVTHSATKDLPPLKQHHQKQSETSGEPIISAPPSPPTAVPSGPQQITLRLPIAHKPQQNTELEQALDVCRGHFKALRISTGQPDNAYDCLKRLSRDLPENPRILAELKHIDNYYIAGIKRYIPQHRLSKARQYLSRLKTITPDHPEITALQNMLQEGIAKKHRVKTESRNLSDSSPLTDHSSTPTDTGRFDPLQMITLPQGCQKLGHKSSYTFCLQTTLEMMAVEVTQQLWTDIMGTNPSRHQSCPACPVENVSWFDVQDFIRRLNKKNNTAYRLPTEAEWEYAARAAQSTGHVQQNLAQYANFCDRNCPHEWRDKTQSDGFSHTAPVASLRPNPWGLYDLQGNVWEWVSDIYQASGLMPNADPQLNEGEILEHVYRGGSWGDMAETCAVTNRGHAEPGLKAGALGFRLVLSGGN